jgi:hypothetical protein
MTIPRFVVLSLLVLVSACAACGPATLPDDSERVQQGAECPEGCVVLTSSRDEMRCEADDPECCDWSDPLCGDSGGGGGTPSVLNIAVKYQNASTRAVPTTLDYTSPSGTSVLFSGVANPGQWWTGTTVGVVGETVTYAFTVTDIYGATKHHSFTTAVTAASTTCSFTFKDECSVNAPGGPCVYTGSMVRGFCD